jgi:RNA polymerase sigma-70 factor (sigma-E family)
MAVEGAVEGGGEVEAGHVGQATARHGRAARGGRSGRGDPDGDRTRDAFTAAVADHHRELARFAFRLCGDRTTAEDIVAEAYARVWVQWRKGRVDVLLPYLMRTVANEAYAGHRRRRLAERKDRVLEPPTVEGPFEDRVDDHDQLWSAIGRLAPQQRVVLVLRIVEDLSEEQTSATLGIPPGTVKSRLSRALATLRTIVEGSHV